MNKELLDVLNQLGFKYNKDDKIDLEATNKNGFTPLMVATIRNNSYAIKILLENSANINAKCDDGTTPLICAAFNNSVEAITQLLKNDIDIDAKDCYGYTALVWATFNNSVDVIRILLEHGANIEAQGRVGKTPLMYASENNSIDAIKLLLKNNANIEAQDKNGKTAFIYAMEQNSIDAIKVLLEHGASIDVKHDTYRTALVYATVHNSIDVIKLLLQHSSNVNSEDIGINSALFRAVKNNNVDSIIILLKHGANIEAHDIVGKTPLMYASENNSIEVIKLLLENKANTEGRNKDGCTALMYAAQANSKNAIKLLLEHNANVEAQDKNGKTAFIYATENNSVEAIKILKENGIIIEAQDDYNRTAIMDASKNISYDTIETSVENETNIDTKDDRANTSIEIITSINTELTNNVRILNVEIVPGSIFQPYWKKEMQLIETDKGDFIDASVNDGGYDWRNHIGENIEVQITNSKDYEWITPIYTAYTSNTPMQFSTEKNYYKPQYYNLSVDTTNNTVILPNNFELNAELQTTYELIKSNEPIIFLTGGAGTGKSTFIHYIKKHLKRDTGKNCIVLAPTGIAAVNIGGQTIHSFFRFKTDIFEDKEIKRSMKNLVLDFTDLIIIDEVSMVSSWMLDHIDYALKLWCENKKPFGGKQMLLIGDCYQLPPITNKNDEEKQEYYERWESPFFFAAKALNNLDFKSIQLKKIYRQKDEKFIQMLNRIRKCQTGYEKDIKFLNEKCLVQNRLHNNKITNECLLLTTKNSKAEEVNNEKLLLLKQNGAKYKIYPGIINGDFNFEHFLTPKVLELCIGAKVLITKNLQQHGLVNGNMGNVIGFDKDYVDVKINQNIYRIERETWQSIKYKYDKSSKTIEQYTDGTFTQFPLKLGWAITIHKSQGLTLDSALIDASSSWDSGQVYVALSRVKNISGLLLTNPIPLYTIKSNEYITKIYKKLFQDDNQDWSDELSYQTINLDNSKFHIEENDILKPIEIQDIKFRHPRESEKIQDYVKETMNNLISNNLIPKDELLRLITDYEYCYETFGSGWYYDLGIIKYTLLKPYDGSKPQGYYVGNFNGYYLCSQWSQNNKYKFVNWLYKVSMMKNDYYQIEKIKKEYYKKLDWLSKNFNSSAKIKLSEIKTYIQTVFPLEKYLNLDLPNNEREKFFTKIIQTAFNKRYDSFAVKNKSTIIHYIDYIKADREELQNLPRHTLIQLIVNHFTSKGDTITVSALAEELSWIETEDADVSKQFIAELFEYLAKSNIFDLIYTPTPLHLHPNPKTNNIKPKENTKT